MRVILSIHLLPSGGMSFYGEFSIGDSTTVQSTLNLLQ